MRLSRKILKTQYTDEFGGYSKTWFNDGLNEVKNSAKEKDLILDHDEMEGDQFGMDCLARSLGLDIEALAKQLAVAKDTAYIKPS